MNEWAVMLASGAPFPREAGDRLIAFACAARITGLTEAHAGWTGEDHRVTRLAARLADWLQGAAGDAGAAKRRTCLCLAAGLSSEDADWRDITRTADWILRFADGR